MTESSCLSSKINKPWKSISATMFLALFKAQKLKTTVWLRPATFAGVKCTKSGKICRLCLSAKMFMLAVLIHERFSRNGGWSVLRCSHCFKLCGLVSNSGQRWQLEMLSNKDTIIQCPGNAFSYWAHELSLWLWKRGHLLLCQDLLSLAFFFSYPFRIFRFWI